LVTLELVAKNLYITQQQVKKFTALAMTNARVTKEILQVLMNLRDKGILDDEDFDEAPNIKAEYDSDSQNPQGGSIQPEDAGTDENRS
jgi:hypothetical protein